MVIKIQSITRNMDSLQKLTSEQAYLLNFWSKIFYIQLAGHTLDPHRPDFPQLSMAIDDW